MRSAPWTRWATCALAITVSLPVTASPAPRGKSLAGCTTFEQTNKDPAIIQFTIRNRCTIPLDCSIRWRVVCAPDSRKRRAAHPGSSAFALTAGALQTAEASAGVCGDDAWLLDQVHWSCQPNKD